MTQIKLKWVDLDAKSPYEDAAGRVTITPLSRRVDGDAIVTGTPVTVILDGEKVVNLPANESGQAYKFSWNNLRDEEDFVEWRSVPESSDVLPYVHLDLLDPETLVVDDVEMEASWWT